MPTKRGFSYDTVNDQLEVHLCRLEVLVFNGVASAVNELRIVNAATGNNPIITNSGEADTGITLAGYDGTNTEEILILDANAGAVNELTIDNAVAGGDVVIAATGGDTNIDLEVSPKGSGNLKFGNAGSWTANATATITISNVGPAGIGTATISKWFTVQDCAGAVYYVPAWT